MTLYTSKVIAEWLGVTERRVRQLRDEGVIAETRPGLYALRSPVPRSPDLNIRSRFLSIPAKLAPALVAASGDQAVMYDLLKRAICETLEELTDYRSLLEEKDEDEETENEDH